ncbi:MAG TPA: Uma2 family endonuclease [Polyangia bacterium]|jgi:Uma2 family endonuclease|nr:Uma2 family endonuclease [Polyangia bacterium]
MAARVGTPPATYEDLLRVPDHLVAEIIDGELVTSPRPAIRHAAASSTLLHDIYGSFDRRRPGGAGGWVILMEPELHVVGQVMVPDLAGWRTEHLPRIGDEPYFETAPDWACEILSPSTMALDRTRKMRHYAAAGVTHLWLLDPKPETLEVYRQEGDSWRVITTAAGAVNVRVEPFEAMELELARVWAR